MCCIVSWILIGNTWANESRDCVEVDFEDGPKVILNKSKVEKYSAVLEWPSERITGVWITPPGNTVEKSLRIHSVLLEPKTNLAPSLNQCDTLSERRIRCIQVVSSTDMAYSVIFTGEPTNRAEMLDSISVYIKEQVLICDKN